MEDQFPASGLQHADRPLCHLFSALQTQEERFGSDLCPAVDFGWLSHDFPRDSGDLVGQSHDDLVAMHALFKLSDPSSQGMSLPVTCLNAGSCAVYEQPS